MCGHSLRKERFAHKRPPINEQRKLPIMPSKPVKYYFGRLNLIATYQDKREFLLRGLRTDKFVQHRNHVWGFFDIKELQSNQGFFIHGYLVKYKPEGEQEVAIPEKHSLGEVRVPNTVVAKSRFFLHVESGLIAYHPVGGQIEIDTFTERFVEIFHEALDKFFVNAEIQAIEERFQVLELMKKFRSISKVEIYLHPSNPNLAELWKNVDQRLKKIGVTNYKETYESDKRDVSLTVTDDEEIRSKIAMAEDGYGKGAVTGELEGETRTITTSDNPITAEASGDDEQPAKVLEELSKSLQNIFDRFIR